MRTPTTLPLALIAAILPGAGGSPARAEPELTHTRLFKNHDKVVYRIPALAISTKGTLLAVCNARARYLKLSLQEKQYLNLKYVFVYSPPAQQK